MTRSSSTLRVLLVVLVALPFAAGAQAGTAASGFDDVEDAPALLPVEDEFDHVPRAAKQPRPTVVHPDRPVVSPPTPATARGPTGKAGARAAEPRAPAPAPPAAKVVPPVVLARAGTAEILAAFEQFRQASAQADARAAAAAQKALLELKGDLAIVGLDAPSMAFARAAQKRQLARDDLAAVELAQAAVELSPGLPWAQWALAGARFRSEPAEVRGWAGPLFATVGAVVKDPRYRRPALADLGAAAIFALLSTAVALVLGMGKLRFFLHDVHHLFPRAAARWQTAPLAVLLLSLPLVFRLGLVPVVATVLVAGVLYLGVKERLVAAALLAVLGAAPLLAHAVTEATAFGGTPAEEVYRLERGGTDADAAAEAVRARAGRNEATFAELYALSWYELSRGRLHPASDLMKKAALLRANDPALAVLLGNARFGAGDMEGAAAHFRRARELDPTLAAASWNLSRVHYRNAAQAEDAARAVELERAQAALSQAQLAGPDLLARAQPAEDEHRLNRLLLSPPLPARELSALATVPGAGKRVADQLSWRLLGTTSGPLMWFLPGVLALAVFGLGALRGPLGASKGCDKCGRPVCRRCDPELGLGSSLCGQCVNVFARKGLVAPQVKLRKQIEVDRYQTRGERLAWLLGIVCSGAGHLVSGGALRGPLFIFGFLFLVSLAVLRDGVLRAPYGELPVWVRLGPAVVGLAVVYLLSLRSLRKTREG
jgi:tetratricopeptide (TPR) repeat protein